MDTKRFEAGLEVRKKVIGEKFVERALTDADDFTRPLQELITEFAWGAVWAREGLSHRDRSLLNIGMLTALGRPQELKLHLEGALKNGLTKDEIREALLQTAIYCGFPAALEAFRCAQEVLGRTQEG